MGMEEEIFRALNLISETTSKTAERLVAIELHNAAQAEACKHHIVATEQLQKAIFNDGTGLKTRVQVLESCKAAVKTSKAIWQGVLVFVIKSLIVAGILAAIALIFKFNSHVENTHGKEKSGSTTTTVRTGK
jgi:hypothetical protein